jgi:hypothetical protein
MSFASRTVVFPLALIALSFSMACRAEPSQPVAETGPIFTDLSSAPLAAKVTIYGSGLGTTGDVTLGGVKQNVDEHKDNYIVFTVSGAGGDLFVGTRSIGKLPVHAGRILESTPKNLKSVWASARPGDVVYMRAGTYRSISGEGDWAMDSTLETFKQGTALQPIALVGYPGERVILEQYAPDAHAPIALGDGQRRRAAYLTFANFEIVATDVCVGGGGDSSDSRGGPDESGAFGMRLVNLQCQLTRATGNTMTGMISLQGDGWKILGNTFVDPINREIINNNHAIYIQGGADDVEVAYNRLVNLHMGHVIQVHQDGKPKLYERVSIHDNLLEAQHPGDMRGINVANVDDSSTFTIERNTLRNLGQDFSGIAIYRGQAIVKDNLFFKVRAPNIVANGHAGGSRRIIASGNRFETVQGYKAIDAENGATLDDVKLSNNRYCGVAAQESGAKPCK